MDLEDTDELENFAKDGFANNGFPNDDFANNGFSNNDFSNTHLSNESFPENTRNTDYDYGQFYWANA